MVLRKINTQKLVQQTVQVGKFLTMPSTRGALQHYGKGAKPAFLDLLSSDVYTLASAISTTAILSFFPFAILIITIVRHVFRSAAAYDVIVGMMRQYLPAQQDFIIRNLEVMTDKFGGIQLASAIILLVSATGVFVPIEVTLNRTWHAPANMSFIKNQIVSLGLVTWCGFLALVSFYVAGLNLSVVRFLFGWLPFPSIAGFLVFVIVKVFGFALSIAIFFSVYYILPNIHLNLDKTLRASICTGVLWEISKYAYIRAIPVLDLNSVYGPFSLAVTLILWCYLSALIMILGADLAHRDLLSLEPLRHAYAEWSEAERQKLAESLSHENSNYDIGSVS
jgi:membrane protein